MKGFYFTICCLIIISCSNRSETLKLTSFRVIDNRDFEICFNENVEGKYFDVAIQTKSGREMKKESFLVVPKDSSGLFCFRSQKMQLSFRAYSDSEKRFYEDSMVNDNIKMIKWSVQESNTDSSIIAEGILKR